MVNDKQFLLSKHIYYKDGWLSERLNSGFIISWQEKLHVYISSDKQIAVLGEVWQVDPDRDDPFQEIEKAISLSEGFLSKETLIDIENTWCGRYVIISSEFVFLDASGLLGVFYTKNSCSSSLNVISEVEKVSLTDSQVEYGLSPNFIPGPLLPAVGVRRLLPCQLLKYPSGETLIRKLLPDNAIEYQDMEQQCKDYLRYSDISLKNMSQWFKNRPMAVALTGGRDSRLTMALLLHAGVDFVTYTFGYDKMSKGDKIIPKQLSECAKKKFYFYDEKGMTYNQSIEKDYDSQVSGLVKDRDRSFFANGLYQKFKNNLQSDIILLRSSTYAGVYEYEYYSRLNSKGILDVNACFPICKYNMLFKKAIAAYENIINSDTINTNISDWKRYYWDLRIGCWMSSIELGFDMLEGITSIHPMNSRIFLRKGFDMCIKVGSKDHEEILTKYAYPELADIPYDYYLERMNSKGFIKNIYLLLNRFFRVSSKYGLFNGVDFLVSRFLNNS